MTYKQLSEAIAHAVYKAFIRADDDVELEELSDTDLERFRDRCQKRLIDAEEELRRRGL